jgi:Ser/Thr protein kinase RdoA (MazF antagonist)
VAIASRLSQSLRCRFFMSRKAFEVERATYDDADLAQLLPQLRQACDNIDGAVRSSCRGFVFPPFLAVERGINLKQWVAKRRNFGEVLNMLESTASLLKVLHDTGRVHRDLKPSNVIYLPHRTAWLLLDLGRAAPVGVPFSRPSVRVALTIVSATVTIP